jgi:aminocarboxymuconate-semialdehyde decarboxylase
MIIDVHSHYVPRLLLNAVGQHGQEIGVQLQSEADKLQCLRFENGFKTRPFFPKLVEPAASRIASLDRQGISHQIVATWPDIYGYGLPKSACVAWHRMLNDTLADWVSDCPGRFSFMASLPLTAPENAKEELDRALASGAIAAMIPANVDGVNIGECQLDDLWRTAEAASFPIFIHPVSSGSLSRVARFGLAQIADYTFDTTLGIGSLIFSGVLDRFPSLRLVLAHGGGAFPYLLGRFDVVHKVSDREKTGDVAQRMPSEYSQQIMYDTVLHSPRAVRFVADSQGIDHLLLGTDESFPPADTNPLGTLGAAGFSTAEVKQIAETNALRFFPRLRRYLTR